MMRETVAGESVKSKAAINEKTKDERIKDEKINGGGASDGIPDTPLAGVINVLSLLRFAFPSMVMMVFMGLYTIADTVFVSRFVNADALASVNIACPAINLIVGFGTMLAAGGSAVVAAKMGCGRLREACRDFTVIILAGAVIGAGIMAGGLSFLDEIAAGLGASEVLMPYCREYLKIQFLFAVGNMLQVLYQNLLVTAGKPKLGLILSVLAGLANLVFDWLFIVRMEMGIGGAALGTGIGYLIPAVCGTVFFLRKKDGLRFCFSEIAVGFPGIAAIFPKLGAIFPGADAGSEAAAGVLKKSCLNGASEMVSQMSAAVTTFLFNGVMMGLSGEDGVAAITVIIYSQFLLTTLYIGFSMGCAPVLSFHYGSGDTERLRKTIKACLGVVGTVSVGIFFFSLLAGESIAGLFAGDNEKVFWLAKTGFFYFSFSFLFSGYNILTSAMFTALSDGRRSAAVSFLRTFGFITVFLLVLPHFLQETGVWLAIPAAEICTSLAAGLVWRCRKKERV